MNSWNYTRVVLLLLPISWAATGCASKKSDPGQEELDRLWKQGYGSNNPNAAHMKNRFSDPNWQPKEPESFTIESREREARAKDKGWIERMFD